MKHMLLCEKINISFFTVCSDPTMTTNTTTKKTSAHLQKGSWLTIRPEGKD